MSSWCSSGKDTPLGEGGQSALELREWEGSQARLPRSPGTGRDSTDSAGKWALFSYTAAMSINSSKYFTEKFKNVFKALKKYAL